MTDLLEQFIGSAERAGFLVHRGTRPDLPNAGVSHALYGLADTGSVGGVQIQPAGATRDTKVVSGGVNSIRRVSAPEALGPLLVNVIVYTTF